MLNPFIVLFLPKKKKKKKTMYSSENILRLEVREVPFLFYRFLGVNNVIGT